MPIISLEIRINSCNRGNFASRSPASLRRIWELIVTRPKLRRRPEGARSFLQLPWRQSGDFFYLARPAAICVARMCSAAFALAAAAGGR